MDGDAKFHPSAGTKRQAGIYMIYSTIEADPETNPIDAERMT